jgi:uncharacterized protein (TIGR02147 family)
VAVELLLRLGLVRRKEDGGLELTDRNLTTEVPLVAAHNFQLATMDLAKESIDRFPRDRRSISTLTLSLSPQIYRQIEEKLAAFRREVLEMMKNNQYVVDRVCQFNFQIFPLTEVPDEPT